MVPAKKNGNRTSFADAKDGAAPTTVAYCYDHADRLTGTAVTGAAVGASPVAGGNLTETGPLASLAYDARGNTTRLGDQTLGYDVANRHTSTTMDDGTVIEYLRDATNRIVQRTSTAPGQPVEVIRFAFAGSGDGAWGVLSGTNTVSGVTIGLPGGAQVRVDASGSPVGWSYANLHGDVIIQTDTTGLRVGVRASYDPFGQPIDPVTGDIGTTTADDAVPDTITGSDADYAWVGGHRKLYEHQGTIAAIEMGARVYVPSLGRFMSVDPVEGGVTNAYDYPADPINRFDLSGKLAPFLVIGLIVVLVLVLSMPASTQQPPKPKPRVANPNPFPFPAVEVQKDSAGKVVPETRKDVVKRCQAGGCASNRIGVQECFIGCVSVALSFREDQRILTSVGFGVGPKGAFTVHIGRSAGQTSGVAHGGSCGAAYGVGVEGGASWTQETYLPEHVPPGWSSYGGLQFGAGAGCSVGTELTW